MNKLLILEDNLNFSRNLLNYIVENNKKLQLFNIAVDGEEVIEKAKKLESNDIILLDLGLPKINGIDIIKMFIEEQKPIPHIIVMSGNTQLMKELRPYEDFVDVVVQKPFPVKRMLLILNEISHTCETSMVDKMIKRELAKFDFNKLTVGYQYIVEAIKYCLEDENLLKDMKNSLYAKIAEKHKDATYINVKWTVEKCIRSVQHFTATKIITEYFDILKEESLTPKMFISVVANKLQWQYKRRRERIDR